MSSLTHQKIHVKCTMDQPIQLLIQKLSSKSSDLYIFWQNYNQMYIQYNEKVQQVIHLRRQIQGLKTQKFHSSSSDLEAINSYKQMNQKIQRDNQQLRNEIQKQKSHTNELKRENTKIIQESVQLRTLITQLRQQNNLQKISIQKILTQLKQAQNQINSYSKAYQQLSYKETIINKFIQRQNEFQQCLAEKQDQIELLLREFRQIKIKYQQIVQQQMQNAKSKVLENLPVLLRNSKHKVKIVNQDHIHY